MKDETIEAIGGESDLALSQMLSHTQQTIFEAEALFGASLRDLAIIHIYGRILEEMEKVAPSINKRRKATGTGAVLTLAPRRLADLARIAKGEKPVGRMYPAHRAELATNLAALTHAEIDVENIAEMLAERDHAYHYAALLLDALPLLFPEAPQKPFSGLHEGLKALSDALPDAVLDTTEQLDVCSCGRPADEH